MSWGEAVFNGFMMAFLTLQLIGMRSVMPHLLLKAVYQRVTFFPDERLSPDAQEVLWHRAQELLQSRPLTVGQQEEARHLAFILHRYVENPLYKPPTT